MWQFVAILIMAGTLAFVIAQMRRSRHSQLGADAVQGTLLVTGVSPLREGATGEQLVTITGALTGPTIAEYITYRDLVRDASDWPRMGDLIPVAYPPKNPDRWEPIAVAPIPPADRGHSDPPREYPYEPPAPPSSPPPPPSPPSNGPGDPGKGHEPPPRYYEPPPL